MSATDDTDVLMGIIRSKLESYAKGAGLRSDYNLLTPLVHDHYLMILQHLVNEHFKEQLHFGLTAKMHTSLGLDPIMIFTP
jgi:hypothetical protein